VAAVAVALGDSAYLDPECDMGTSALERGKGPEIGCVDGRNGFWGSFYIQMEGGSGQKWLFGVILHIKVVWQWLKMVFDSLFYM
jgi:hypothetical protein